MLKNTSLMRYEDGSIYHLRLHPGELATRIILVGDPARSRTIADHFDNIEMSRRHREFEIFTGVLQGQRLSVVSTGIGMGSVDIVMNEIDALFNIDFVTNKPKAKRQTLCFVRFGTAGSLQPDLPVGSLVASAYAFGMDGLLHYYKRETSDEILQLESSLRDFFSDMRMVGGLYAAAADPSLLNHFSSVARSGITFTCSGFFGPQGRELRTPLTYPNLIETVSEFRFADYRLTNFEMETAAIYGLSEVLGHRCCSISAIMANRRAEQVGNYNVVVDDMIQQLLNHMCEIEVDSQAA